MTKEGARKGVCTNHANACATVRLAYFVQGKGFTFPFCPGRFCHRPSPLLSREKGETAFVTTTLVGVAVPCRHTHTLPLAVDYEPTATHDSASPIAHEVAGAGDIAA